MIEKIYLGGVGGVGKTTLGKMIAKEYGFDYFSGAALVMEISGVETRKELEGMNPDKKREIERAEYPAFVKSRGRVLVDGHCQLMPEQAECFDLFIYLHASPENIRERREKRGRRNIDLNEIKKEQAEYINRVRATEKACDIRFIELSNDGEISETISRFIEIIK